MRDKLAICTLFIKYSIKWIKIRFLQITRTGPISQCRISILDVDPLITIQPNVATPILQCTRVTSQRKCSSNRIPTPMPKKQRDVIFVHCVIWYFPQLIIIIITITAFSFIHLVITRGEYICPQWCNVTYYSNSLKNTKSNWYRQNMVFSTWKTLWKLRLIVINRINHLI